MGSTYSDRMAYGAAISLQEASPHLSEQLRPESVLRIPDINLRTQTVCSERTASIILSEH